VKARRAGLDVPIPIRLDESIYIGNGITVRFRALRTYGGDARKLTMGYTKSLVFTYGEPPPAMVKPPPSRKGVDLENDKLWRKYNKLEIKSMKSFILSSLGFLGISPGRLRFSRNTGCSMCPCSPGHRTQDGPLCVTLESGDKVAVNVWITHESFSC